MNTMDIAKKLVVLCKEGKQEEAKSTLYAEDAVSVEAAMPPGMEREAHGIAAIVAKGKWWRDNHDIHSVVINGPWPHDDRFIINFEYDVTHKPTNQRMQMSDVGLYTVKNGKIVREEFFYDM
ncbi:MAG: nuclear transport factor 2 family protein [Burkholderiales bacterium]|nr:nuclear transport factor 2 family protein [Burkholderiales bacterium]